MIVFKAMGFVSDQQIVQMIGTESNILSRIVYSLHECANLEVFSRTQALEYVSGGMSFSRFPRTNLINLRLF